MRAAGAVWLGLALVARGVAAQTSINSVQRWVDSVEDIHVQRGGRTTVKLDTSFVMPNKMEDQVTVTVDEVFTVYQVALTLSGARHERVGDLSIKLVSPDDRTVVLLKAGGGDCPLGDGKPSLRKVELYKTETLGDQNTHPRHGVDYTFSTSAAAAFPPCEDLQKLIKQAKDTGLPLPWNFDAQAWHVAHAVPGGTYRESAGGNTTMRAFEGVRNPKKGKWKLVMQDALAEDIGYFTDACLKFVDSMGKMRGPFCMDVRTGIVSTNYRTVKYKGVNLLACGDTPPCISATSSKGVLIDPVEDQSSYPWRSFHFTSLTTAAVFAIRFEVGVNGKSPEGTARSKVIVTDIGCTDPKAFNYQKAATWPLHSVDTSYCNYTTSTCDVNDANNHVPLRIPVRSPNSRTASYTIDHSAGALIAARLRDEWLQSDCDGVYGTYNDPIGAPCTHRFYRDTWQLTVRKLDEHHTQVVVSRVDEPYSKRGWAYDGLQIEYTTCGQSGASGGRQGLWRPTEASFAYSAESVRPDENCSFVRTRDCDPDGPIELGMALRCGAVVREGWSGYCSCRDRKTYKKGCENHPPFTCKDACAVPDGWLCDPTWCPPARPARVFQAACRAAPCRARARPPRPRGIGRRHGMAWRAARPLVRRLMRAPAHARTCSCAPAHARTCSARRYDNGMCDVACGASDPDCSRDTVVPWARLAEPMYLGQGPRRDRNTRGWS